MSGRTGVTSRVGLWLLVAASVVPMLGCGSVAGPRRAGRTDVEREQLIKPGTFGNNAAADRRRGFFDFWNEQVIREDVAVSTVFMGDSITELWQLGVYFVPSDGLILNRGISGDLATHMAKRFQADVVQLHPRQVVILAGTNDVARMSSGGKTDEEIITSVTTSVQDMMGQARAAGIRVLVCSILPTNSDTKNHEPKARILPQINEKLRAACTQQGAIYVDYAEEMRDDQGALLKDLARDGLHPHYAGYRIMADALKEVAARHGLRL